MNARRVERVYALLLRAYPEEFRAAYGREMTLAFRGMARDAGAADVGFWLEIVRDVARTAPALRVEALHARWSARSTMTEGRMKPMGILGVLIGLTQAVNAIVELSGGAAERSGIKLSAVVLAVLVGALLVVAGVAMLRRSSRAALLAQIAALSWLALAVIVRVVYPWMSLATMTLAVVFPVVLLVWAWARGRAVVAR